jgi:hypothetical protein
MKSLILRSWFTLLYFDFVMWSRGFNQLHTIIRTQRVRPVTDIDCSYKSAVCEAVDLACVFYFKRVLCLQRSAATTVLLRRFGFDAEMVIGAQPMPFKSHAWVEVRGTVVNDKPYVSELYQVLERC